MIQFTTLEKLVRGNTIQMPADRPVTTLLTDSRKAIVNEGSLFFAIVGERHDGHDFIPELYRQGIRQFVVEKNVKLQIPEANILKVTNSIEALQLLAQAHREQFKIPVIGITGSNGKTIVKEWLYQLLYRDFSIIKNPGSYNSQIGVPLSVWNMQPHHQFGIFEAGISLPGEMEKLERIIQPSIGIFTNIGSAHDEGFPDTKQKIKEKLKLFKNTETLIYCQDHTAIASLIQEAKIPALSWTFGHQQADITIHPLKELLYQVKTALHEFTLSLPFSDHASVENCFHCIAAMLCLRFKPEDIKERIRSLRAVPMRLELKEGVNQCQIIDDSYNNDLNGLQIGLDFLTHQHQKKKKRLILSDILQSGLNEDELIKKIASLIDRNRVDSFVGIGNVLKNHEKSFSAGSTFYASTEDFLQSNQLESYRDEVILVKGARPFEFEKIVNRLQKKVHGTVMEIDLGALVNNLNYFKSQLPSATKIMVMVKAFAYGSGSTEIANALQYHKVDYLGVAYPDEGVDLRRNNISIPIMVMNSSEESFDKLLSYNLEPEIYSFKMLRALIDFLHERRCSVHIKLDTGMHRLGFEESDLEELIGILQKNKHIQVASIFSHLAGADENVHDEFSMAQSERFLAWADKIAGALDYKPLYHLLNSPGILRLTGLHLDMVRLGIGLYGIDPSGPNSQLKPVATLKTIISQIKRIRTGETVGYSRVGIAKRPTVIATLAIGYADGYSRAFSRGVGEVLINGKRASVMGNVCMDMTMVDITDIDAREGDEAIIFGTELPIQEVASKINTIPYEILTSVSERVRRIFVAESI